MPKSLQLHERASELKSTGKVCGFGASIQALPDDQAAEVAAFVMDRSHTNRIVAAVLGEKVGIETTETNIQRHRNGCKWCTAQGVFA